MTIEQKRSPGRPKTRGEREQTGRAKRVPMGTPELKLSIPQALNDKEHVYRWINDVPGRLQRAQAGGYEFVEDQFKVGSGSEDGNAKIDTRLTRIVGKTPQGTPLFAYAMRIKKEFYEEDQEAKMSAIDEVESGIKNGNVKWDAEADRDKGYTPKEGISIR